MGLFDKLKGKKDKSKEWRDKQKIETGKQTGEQTGEQTEEDLDQVYGGPSKEYYDAVNGRIINSGNER